METYARLIGLACPQFNLSPAQVQLWEITACLASHDLPANLWRTCQAAARDSISYEADMCAAIHAIFYKLAQHKLNTTARLAHSSLEKFQHPWFVEFIGFIEELRTAISPRPRAKQPPHTATLLDDEVWVCFRQGKLMGIWPKPQFAGNLLELAVLRNYT